MKTPTILKQNSYKEKISNDFLNSTFEVRTLLIIPIINVWLRVIRPYLFCFIDNTQNGFCGFLYQTIPDIISAYWVFWDVKVIAKKAKLHHLKKFWIGYCIYTCSQLGSAIILYRSYLCLKKTHFVNLNAATSSVFFFIQKVISKRRSKSRLSDGTRASSENSRIIRQVICHFN